MSTSPLDNPVHPQKSGARAVLDATAVVDAAIKHAENLQNAVNDIHTLCEHAGTNGVIPLKRLASLLESHHV